MNKDQLDLTPDVYPWTSTTSSRGFATGPGGFALRQVTLYAISRNRDIEETHHIGTDTAASGLLEPY